MKAIATVGERLQLIKDWQLSGLTASEWCRRNGIHKNTFSNWIHRARKQGLLETPAVIPQSVVQDPVHQDIVKIEVSRNPEAVSTGIISEMGNDTPGILSSNNSGAVMEVSLGSVRIKVTNQVSLQLLAETIRLLGGDVVC